MTGPARLAVVVVSFNTREVLRPCLESVVAARPAELIVVDNGSTDGSVELVEQGFPGARLLRPDRNLGYGGAANAGIRACASGAVLLLNSDTLLAPETLGRLHAALDAHPRAAVVGPRLVNADGSLQRSTYPWPSAGDTFLGESGLHLVVRRVPVLRERFWRTWSHDRGRAVPWLLGAALVIRREPFDAVGGFDEAFFMYGEEVDLCRRLTEAGHEIRFEPAATITHLGGASTSTDSETMRREFIVSKARFLRRHASRRQAAGVLVILRLAILARWARDALRGDRRMAAARLALVRERALWRA